jgi:putative Mg2+ transporter-C (MgtC) family protein
MTEIFASNPFNILPHIVALSIAYVLALPIGWNRERAERSAGLRTFPLVAVASCGFIQAAESLTLTMPKPWPGSSRV